jgi:hypothetical protein
LPNEQPVPQELHVADAQSEDLPLSESRSGRHNRHRSVGGGHRCHHGKQLLGRPRDDALRIGRGCPNGPCTAGIRGDQTVLHGGAQDRRKRGQLDPHVARGAVRLLRSQPGLNGRGADGPKFHWPECRQQVSTET